jgi:hypothetical protein
MNDLKELSQAMFSPSTPVNPIPFLNGLVTGLKEKGTDWITTDEAKKVLFVVLVQAYGWAFLLDSFKEYQRLRDQHLNQQKKSRI